MAFEPRLDSGAGLPRVAGRRAVAAVEPARQHVPRHVMTDHFNQGTRVQNAVGDATS